MRNTELWELLQALKRLQEEHAGCDPAHCTLSTELDQLIALEDSKS
jgi:hypothetical protein